MVTSSQECLTPKGHFGIDRPSQLWLRSWQTASVGESRRWEVEPPRRDGPLIRRQVGRLCWTAGDRRLQPLCRGAFFTAVIATVCSCLITVFYPSKSPSRVLSVHTSASAPAFKAITWTRNHLRTTGKSCLKQTQKKKECKQAHCLPSPPSYAELSWDPIIQNA